MTASQRREVDNRPLETFTKFNSINHVYGRGVVEGTRGRGRSRKTWEQCVRDDMKLLGLHPEWAVFRDMWRDLIWGKRLTLA